MKKVFLLLIAVALATSLAVPGLTLAAEEKNNPGVFDLSGGPAKSMVNIGLAFGKGVLIKEVADNAPNDGRMHSRAIGLGSALGVLDTAFDCAVATKCTVTSFLTDAAIAAITGGATGYGISEIGGDSPWVWAGLTGAALEAVDEFGGNPAVYGK